MKLLLDENFPKKVSLDFPNHSFFRVEDFGWKGKKNGELLELMIKEGFDGLITLDQKLPKQQNLKRYKLKIIVLKSIDSRPSNVQPLIEKLKAELKYILKKQIIEID